MNIALRLNMLKYKIQDMGGSSCLVLGLGVGSVLGTAVGVYVSSKHLSKIYERIANEEIAEVKKHYQLLSKEGIDVEELAARREAKEHTTIVNQYNTYSQVVPDEEELLTQDGVVVSNEDEIRNIFDNQSEDPWNYVAESKNRSEEKPYILHQDEFMQNQKDYDQTTLTYFEGDGALIDSFDQHIPDVNRTIGRDNLRFGHGAVDANTVYIRNDKLEIEYEVVRSEGKYSVEVLGFGDENALEHSNKRQLRRFRDRDE